MGDSPRPVWRSVNDVEKLLCGRAARADAAVVDGFALAGRRGARLHDPARASRLDGHRFSVETETPWIDHRIRPAQPSAFRHPAFELVATSAQEAVDHCLVAHHLAASLGKSGVCSLDPDLAASVTEVQIPTGEQLALFSSSLRRESYDSVLEAARVAFRAVSLMTERDLDVVTEGGTEEAKLVVLADGNHGAVARRIVEALRASGARVSLVIVALIDPLPMDRLRGLVQDREAVVVLASEDAFWPGAVSALVDRETKMKTIHRGFQRREELCREIALFFGMSPEKVTLPAEPPESNEFSASAHQERLITPDPDSIPELARGEQPDAGQWREPMRNFHLTGEAPATPPQQAGPLLPASLAALSRTEPARARFPLVLGDNGGIRSLREFLEENLETPSILRDEVVRFCAIAERHLQELRQARPLTLLLSEVGGLLAEAACFDADSDARMADEIEALKKLLPTGIHAVGCGAGALLDCYRQILDRARRPARSKLLDEIESLTQRLRELVRLDGGDSLSSAALTAALGKAGNALLDPEVLSSRLPRQKGSASLASNRRERVLIALASLENFLEERKHAPDLIVIRPETSDAVERTAGVRVITHPDGLRTAIGLFDGLADAMRPVFQALRVGRLEIENGYDEKRHPARLARLDWQGVPVEELTLLPSVIVEERADRLRGTTLGSFSELLRSGRPVLVLVPGTTAKPGEARRALEGYDPGLGYLAVAHREAFVLQSSLGEISHLLAGLEALTGRVGPAAALVTVPSSDSSIPGELQLAASVHGRAMPYFRYDPEGGRDWIDRFSLAGNPQPTDSWPVLERQILDENRNEVVSSESFTFAHHAALDPSYREHFLCVPPEAWIDELTEIAQYLDLPSEKQRRVVPYLWVLDDRNQVTRAVMTRELAFACRDRARAWRILQELGGANNEYARRAEEQARHEAEEERTAKIAELEAAHEALMQQSQSDGARLAVQRIVSGLMGTEAPLPEGAVAAVSEPASVAESAVAAAEPQPEEPAVATAVAEEPYIDSFLCTTCNECINLNPRLFAYNTDHQAVINDASSGTFKELVKAAEKCPARCIHPGKPRADDKTATPAMVERAAEFS